MTDHKDLDSDDEALPQEDQALWDAYVSDVKPLREDKTRQNSGKKPRSTADTPQTPRDITGVDAPQIDHSQKTSKRSTEIDAKTLKRLKRGDIVIEGRLDLHGLNQGEARQALFRFIREAYVSGKRSVLVITGKGNSKRSGRDWLETEPGVLKRNVPCWLQEEDMQDIVLQFVKAQPRHGGSGALYVYLRRKR